MRFQDRVVMVTGAASGIGKAAALKFLAEGAYVVGVDLNPAPIESPRFVFEPVDIADDAQDRAAVARTLERFGRIDVLVNNAAIFILKSIDAEPADWEAMLRVNIMGQALITKHVVEAMKRQRSGAIVNLGSISAWIAQPNQLTYNVTKAAMLAMTRCLALDLKEYGIRVNTVSPGWVMTENVHHLLYDERRMDDAAIRAEVGSLHLSGRLAQPSEIADAIAYMASDEASFVNGANLMVDGGYTTV